MHWKVSFIRGSTVPAVIVLVIREDEKLWVGVVTCEEGEEGRGEVGVAFCDGDIGEGGRGCWWVSSSSVFLFLLGRIVVWTMLRNLPTEGSTSSGGWVGCQTCKVNHRDS